MSIVMDDGAAPVAPLHTPLHRPTVRELFLGFLKLGLVAFGGALPLVRRMAVEEQRWVDGEEFTDLLGLCQVLPGGNVINLSVVLGMRFQGVRGAVAALLGFVAAPTMVVIALGGIYDHFRDNAQVAHFFAGLAAAAAGLMISVALRIAGPMRGRPVSIIVAALFFAAIAVLRLPLLPTMLVLVPVSVFIVRKVGP
ncbi:MAG: multidrug efflux transporter protein [Betaproteobacteria bacterium]|nr:multidrug efflux transporter protein [Betaproteobacteria bacterium]